ncbi:MAG: DUF2889 domain-containing protein [Acetobacteraceae bacterium]|nr:DUF2889 domain-containing protein [Acetobacteraceae bacterium]
MALSPAAPRKKLHNRQIVVEGFEREDGLFDIEAELIDTKTYAFNIGHRELAVGDSLHRMRARLTVNFDFEIVAAEAVTLAGPFSICAGGAESFSKLVGLTIKAGFLKAANERLGGVMGCTHIREFLQQMATIAFQTTYPARARREEAQSATGDKKPPRLLNTCFAYDSTRAAVKERFPEYYTGE